MVLCAYIPLLAGHLHNLDQMGIGVLAHTLHASGFKLLAVVVVELEAMAMPLLDVELAIGLGHLGSRLQVAGIGAQAHGAAHVGHALLLFHQVDHVVGRVGVELGTVGLGKAHHVAGKLDDHALHAQAYAEGGHVVLAAPL